MIQLNGVLECLKTLDNGFENYYMGFLDKKKDKSLGVYNLKRNRNQIIALGGLENTSYNVKQISLLIHWNKAVDESEQKAIELYEKLLTFKPEKINGHSVSFIGMLTNEPIEVGKNDNGICEYVIEFEIYYQRKKEE